MADYLIKHLKKKAEEHTAIEMLSNQWGFDKNLIPKALEAVGNLFPHYSRHDVSHSVQILINIERLLGPVNIDRLTATDTWLILEAAYWHDIGMVVPRKDIEKALQDDDFLQYVHSIRNSPSHDLNSFAKEFVPSSFPNCFGGAISPLDAVEKFRLLMAEWFRRLHPDRADKTIQNPLECAGISSPRTELIPARLFGILGRICQMHGVPFSAILGNDGLPYKEAGLAREDCHPRFVACLLRMGDLLDLDDNRFCPVMQRIVGDNRPTLTKAHEEKHSGIRHLRIDSDRIEITAECKTIEGYLETFKWFDWLKQEIQDQMAHWQDIVPSREFGLLPTLGEIGVRLSGEHQVLKEGSRPQFSIDGPQAIKLLQGTNLYSTKFACVRELLQNAVDATLLLLWLRFFDKPGFIMEQWETPFATEAKERLKETSIKISLSEAICDPEIMSDQSYWTLTITDTGTGISREDLTHMLCIGGSQKNHFRQKKIASMPEWMKPSGAFGIGFQSVFLLADVVTLKTKSVFSNETLEVTMYSPTGEKEGLAIIKTIPNEVSHDFGTTVTVKFPLEKITKHWSVSIGDNKSLASQFLGAYDPVLDDTFPLEAAQLADQINLFSKNSLLPIEGFLHPIKKHQPIFLTTQELFLDNPCHAWHFLQIEGHCLAMQFTPIYPSLFERISTFYRGQPFKQNVVRIPFAEININLLSGKAGVWLTANRDNLNSNAADALESLVIKGLEKIATDALKNLDSLEERNPNYKMHFSLFLKGMALRYKENWITLSAQIEDLWLNLPTGLENKTFRDFFESQDWSMISTSPSSNRQPKGFDLIISQADYNSGLFEYILLHEWSRKKGRSIQVVLDQSPSDRMPSFGYRLSSKDQVLYSNDVLATALAKILDSLHENRRLILPMDSKWEKLFLKPSTSIKAYSLFPLLNKEQEIVLLPYLFYGSAFSARKPLVSATHFQIEQLASWIQPHLQRSLDLMEIRKIYLELIDYIDQEIMGNSIYKKEWEEARNGNDNGDL